MVSFPRIETKFDYYFFFLGNRILKYFLALSSVIRGGGPSLPGGGSHSSSRFGGTRPKPSPSMLLSSQTSSPGTPSEQAALKHCWPQRPRKKALKPPTWGGLLTSQRQHAGSLGASTCWALMPGFQAQTQGFQAQGASLAPELRAREKHVLSWGRRAALPREQMHLLVEVAGDIILCQHVKSSAMRRGQSMHVGSRANLCSYGSPPSPRPS